MKLGILIKLETKEKELKVLNQLNTDLLHQVEVLRRSLKSERDLREFNYKLIVKESKGMLCKVFHEEHKKFYFAFIKEVLFEEQRAVIDFVGYEEEKELPGHMIKIQEIVARDKLDKDYKCGFVNKFTGYLIPYIILQKPDKNMIKVKNLKENEEQEVELKYLLEYKFEQTNNDPNAVNIPQSLKILPNDTKREREIKKKKIKKIKYGHKLEERKKFFDDKKKNWKDFNKKIGKKGY